MKKSVLTRYRVMAYVTGVLLVLLTLGVIAKYVLDLDGADGFTQGAFFKPENPGDAACRSYFNATTGNHYAVQSYQMVMSTIE